MPEKRNVLWRKRNEKTARRSKLAESSGLFWQKLCRVLTTPWRIFAALCFCVGFCVLAFASALYLYVASFLNSLPQLDKMEFADLQRAALKRIHERAVDKRLKHRWVALKDVSRDYLYSLVFSEDATFFEHSGFNFDAITESLAENLREKKPAYGGSTISQQVVKNLFLTSEKTLLRKAKEFLLTRSLEKRFSKNEILEVYFNVADFGPDIFGVAAAAQHFFGKRPADINAAEGAFIGLMLPSPKRNYYAIFENKNLTRQKRKRIERVLRDMLYEEYLSEEDYRRYTRYEYYNVLSPSRLPARFRRGGF